MFLLYLLIIVICFCLLESFFKERAFINNLSQEEHNVGKVLVLNIGKKISAFTIENTKFVYGTSVISSNFLHKLWLGIKNIFFTDLKTNNYLKSLSARTAIALMKKNAENAEYIVNAKVEYIHLGKGKMLAHAYGTAIYLYKDTLGLFLFPEDRELPPIKKVSYNFLLRSFKALVISICLIFLLHYSYLKYSQHLVSQITYQDEIIMWSYIKDSVLENRLLTQQTPAPEEQLQKLINDLSAANLIPDSSFTVYILKSNKSDIFIYPGGNITITTALLKQITSENGLTFLLANEIGHYLRKHNLTNLLTDLVSVYRALQIFGEDSLLAKIFIRAGIFSDNQFILPQEEVADRFALSVTNHFYGHVAGVRDILLKLNQLTPNENMYAEHHTINQERLANLDRLIAANNYTLGESKAFNIRIHEEATTAAKAPALEDAITLYSQDASYLLNIYKQYLTAFANILALPTNLTLNDLNERYNFLETALKEVDVTYNKFEELTNNYDKKINAVAAKINDVDRKGLLLISWDKAKKNTKKTMYFYLAQDYNVLETEQLIIDFLRKRFGTFTITERGIVFNSSSTLEKYNMLVTRLNEYLNQKPTE